jgi:alkylation response protein AidB-like acyl-CoA dehydrogenase
MNFFSDVAENVYMFKNAIHWDDIINLYYPEFPTADGFKTKEEVVQYLTDLVDATGNWTGEVLAPRARELDDVGAGEVKDGNTYPSAPLSATYKDAKELSLFGMSAEPQYGGMGVPVSTQMISFTQMNRACIASATQLGFFSSMADMVERFCDEEDRARLIPMVVQGDISGSMCLTEPGAGSDVGSLKTSAVKQADGTYLLNGSKIFITNGGGGFGFVLARIKDAPTGLNGISLFLAEQNLNGKQNFKIVKSEHKMGLHGSFTCEVLYENTVAKLVGKEHQGFRYMLHLMNEARIGVGLQCLGGIEACVGYAREYAQTRSQFGKVIADLPLMKRNLQDWETERDAFRALMFDTLSYFDIYQKLDLKKRHGHALTEKEEHLFKKASKWTRRRTPLVKFYGSETFTLLSQRAIQALGGYGFMHEYDAERYHRDSFAPLLYEGTSQIQALMAMKDLMKVIMRSPAKYFQSLVVGHPFGNLFNTSHLTVKEFQSTQYEFKKNLISLIIKSLKPEVDYTDPNEVKKFFDARNWLAEENFDKLMIHAETICHGLSYLEVLRVLSKHASRDNTRTELFNRYKQLVTPRFQAIYSDWRERT